MSVKTNGSSFLSLAQKLATGFPFSLGVWASTDSGAGCIPLSQSQASGDRWAGFFFDANGTTKYGIYRNPGGSGGALVTQTTGQILASTMKLWVVVIESLTKARIYCHSATPTEIITAAITNDIASHDSITIGGLRINGAGLSNALNGNLAEATVFPGIALTDANVTALLAGGKGEDLGGICFPLRDPSDLSDTTGTYTLTVNGTVVNGTQPHPVTRSSPGPNITAHPSNQTVTTPATASFSVTAAATGGGTLSYQWQRSTNSGGSWANVTTGTGGTTSSYTTAATSVSGGNANNADQWRCVVTETGGTNPGSVNSNAATLTVNAAPSGPTINTHPSNQTVTTPATATFTVAATTSGGALSYQWQRSTNGGGSWANVTTGTGGTASSYTTAATSVSGGNANNADQYRCAVTDSNGTTNSNAATLTVNAAAAGLTSSPLKSNNGSLHLSAAFEAFVLNATTGALVLRKTGLTSHASTGVVSFTDAALTAATQYRVVWRRTDTGAQGVELLTAA